MAKLKMTYAWSNSRVKTLRECRWKYFLTYFLAWEGWLQSATQDKQRAYLLKNITNFPMFIGSVIHNIIENIIITGRKTGKWGTLQQAQHDGVQALRKGWKESVGKRWETNPKSYINLSEHFYQEEIPKDRLDEYKRKVLMCLKAFYDCSLFEIMQNLPKEAFLTIEDFAKFQLNTGEEVTVKIDCGFRYNGKVYLLDWKTGKINDNVIEQLVTYNMYCLKQGWTKKPEDIVVVPVYLAAYSDLGEQATPHLAIEMQHMKRQAGIIRSEYPLLVQAFEHKDDPSHFERTDNERACEKCFFRDMCEGVQREIGNECTPF